MLIGISRILTMLLNYYCKWGYVHIVLIILLSLLANIFIFCCDYTQNHSLPIHRRNRLILPQTETIDEIINKMRSQLNLDTQQELDIRPIIENQIRQRNEIIKNRPKKESLIEELKQIRILTEKQLQYFLTNEQMVKYGQMQQEEDQRIINQFEKMEKEGRPPKSDDKERRPGRFPR